MTLEKLKQIRLDFQLGRPKARDISALLDWAERKAAETVEVLPEDDKP